VAKRRPRYPAFRAALGRAVREARTQSGLTQEALADAARLHRNYIGGIERGERNPTLENLYQLATALGRRPSQILERAEELHG
jgi:transcriptional regulator with XRE-family HTH domain